MLVNSKFARSSLSRAVATRVVGATTHFSTTAATETSTTSSSPSSSSSSSSSQAKEIDPNHLKPLSWGPSRLNLFTLPSKQQARILPKEARLTPASKAPSTPEVDPTTLQVPEGQKKRGPLRDGLTRHNPLVFNQKSQLAMNSFKENIKYVEPILQNPDAYYIPDPAKLWQTEAQKAAALRPPSKSPPAYAAKLPNDDPKDNNYDIQLGLMVERWPRVVPDEAEWKTAYHKHFEALRAAKRPWHTAPAEVLPAKSDDATHYKKEHLQQLLKTYSKEQLLETEADRARDVHATHRKLLNSLFLIVKKKNVGWCFPSISYSQLVREKPEAAASAANNLRNIVTTHIEPILSKSLVAHHYSNAPIAVWKHEFDDQTKQLRKKQQLPEFHGAKLFLMPSLYVEGEVILAEDGEYEDFAWCTAEELKTYLPAALCERIDPITTDARFRYEYKEQK